MLMFEIDFYDVKDLLGMRYFSQILLLYILLDKWNTTTGFIYLCF